MVEWHSERNGLEACGERKPQSRIEEQLGEIPPSDYDVQSVAVATGTRARLHVKRNAAADTQAIFMVVKAL